MIIIPDLILILTLIVYLVLVRIKKVRFRLTVPRKAHLFAKHVF